MVQESEKLGGAGEDEFVTANQETRKCAHIHCLCDVPRGIEYCSDSCRDAGSDDVEIACQCDHTACPRRFGILRLELSLTWPTDNERTGGDHLRPLPPQEN